MPSSFPCNIFVSRNLLIAKLRQKMQVLATQLRQRTRSWKQTFWKPTGIWSLLTRLTREHLPHWAKVSSRTFWRKRKPRCSIYLVLLSISMRISKRMKSTPGTILPSKLPSITGTWNIPTRRIHTPNCRRWISSPTTLPRILIISWTRLVYFHSLSSSVPGQVIQKPTKHLCQRVLKVVLYMNRKYQSSWIYSAKRMLRIIFHSLPMNIARCSVIHFG